MDYLNERICPACKNKKHPGIIGGGWNVEDDIPFPDKDELEREPIRRKKTDALLG